MQRVERNIKLLYIHAILRSFLLIAPILVIFMQDRGLTFLQIMLLQSIFSLSSIIFELPSGYFSDNIGRRLTMIISSILLTLAIILFANVKSFYGFVLAEIIFGLAYSLLSGTDSSILYETLLVLNREKEYSKIWGNIQFYIFLSVAVASILGGYIATYSLDKVATLTIIPLLLSIFISFFLIEPTKKEQQKFKSIKDDIKTIKLFLKTDIALIYIMILSSAIFAFNQSAFWLYQPYLDLSAIPLELYGVIFASFQVVAGFASKYLYYIQKKVSLIKILIIVSLISPISITLMGFYVTPFGFLLIYFQQITRSFKSIIISQIINEQVDSTFRATILSISNLIAKLSFAILLPVVGYFMDFYSLSNVLITLGVVGFVVNSVVLMRVLRKSKQIL